MTEFHRLLGANMRIKRKEIGLSQADFAEKCDISTNYVSEIEVGRKFPKPAVLEKIASVLGIDPEDLFTRHALDRPFKTTADLINSILDYETEDKAYEATFVAEVSIKLKKSPSYAPNIIVKNIIALDALTHLPYNKAALKGRRRRGD